MTEHRALCGWLMKQDTKGLWKGWKKRWFQQLHDHQLYYFPSCTTDISLSKGYIDMKLVLNAAWDLLQKDKNIFTISTADRTYVLQANTADEVEYWISGINAIVASLSQPLSTLISRAELYELQKQEHEQRQRASTSVPPEADPNKAARAMSVRYPPLVHSQSTSEMRVSRSSSMQNITYIDYAGTPPPKQEISPSTSASSSSSSTPYSSASASMPFITAPPASLPPSASASMSSISAPPSPATHTTPAPTGGVRPSQPYLDIHAPKPGAKEQETEQEKIEKKKWASMRDIQALIVREKDAEIARLKEEVARINEMHEKAIEETKKLRQDQQQQLDDMKMEQHQRASELERKYTDRIDELSYMVKVRDKELADVRQTARDAIAASELANTTLAQVKRDTDEKITILESEIKLKENVIEKLNSTITSLNGELSAKDTLLENKMREITYPAAFDDVLLVAKLEKERATKQALQEQCAFLGQEVFKLETQLKQQKILIAEQKNKILERAGSSASMANMGSSYRSLSYLDSTGNRSPQMSARSPYSGSAEIPPPIDNSELNLLLLENESLRQKYFMSVGRSLKLQTTMNGGFSNVNITDLYDQAQQQNVKIEAWPNFISNQIAVSLKNST